jgi:hypothetical protein
MSKILGNIFVLALNAVVGFLAMYFITMPLLAANMPFNTSTGMSGMAWAVLSPFIAAGFGVALWIFQISAVSSWKDHSAFKVLLASPLLLSTHLLYLMPDGGYDLYYPLCPLHFCIANYRGVDCSGKAEYRKSQKQLRVPSRLTENPQSLLPTHQRI